MFETFFLKANMFVNVRMYTKNKSVTFRGPCNLGHRVSLMKIKFK